VAAKSGSELQAVALARELRRLSADVTIYVTDRPFQHRRSNAVAFSDLSERSSNSILEVLTHGTPVVATTVGGANELLEGRPMGTLVKPEDPTSVAAVIDSWLILSHDWLLAASEQARAFVSRRFSLAQMAARHCYFYNWALSATEGNRASAARHDGDWADYENQV
jgi:glycosyltransferase involved in cell wall biosynthesis